jgi:branched-chain amino acid transport system ATP-binding protein
MVVQEIVDVLTEVRNAGLSILIVEQNIKTAFDVADRHYILTKGAVCYEGTTEALQGNKALLHQHLGI